jgi:hypothetical protein
MGMTILLKCSKNVFALIGMILYDETCNCN